MGVKIRARWKQWRYTFITINKRRYPVLATSLPHCFELSIISGNYFSLFRYLERAHELYCLGGALADYIDERTVGEKVDSGSASLSRAECDNGSGGSFRTNFVDVDRSCGWWAWLECGIFSGGMVGCRS